MRSEAGEEAVVVAATATEATTVGGEGYAGDDSEVDGCVVGEEGACGLKDVKGTFAEGGCWFTGGGRQFAQFEVVADDNGEEDAFAFDERLTDEFVCVNLVRKRMVEEYGSSGAPIWVLPETGDDLSRQACPFLYGTGCLTASDFLS